MNSGRTDEAIKYLKRFHDRKPFTPLLEVKKIIKYRSKQLVNVPNILDELREIESYLEPDKNEMSSLIKTYVFSAASHLLIVVQIIMMS